MPKIREFSEYAKKHGLKVVRVANEENLQAMVKAVEKFGSY